MTTTAVAQIVIAVSVAWVWIVRLPNVGREFEEYHIPDLIRNLVGASKIALGTLLVAGIWYPSLVLLSALLMAFLMVCAVLAHVRVHHAWQRSVPAVVLLALSLFVAASASGHLPA
jgi:hypothetical protein